MRTSRRSWASVGGLFAMAATTILCGAVRPAAAQAPAKSADQPLVLPVMPAPVPRRQVLSLEQLAELAAQNHPDLVAARARLLAAQGKYVQAGLYPNPTFGPRQDEWGWSDPIGHPGANISQEFVTAGKLRWARAAAAAGVQAADWQTVTRWFDVLTRVRFAYFEVLAAQREVQTVNKIVDVSKQALAAALRLEKAGVGSRPDSIRAQVELEQNTIRLTASERRLDAAWRLLAVAVGLPDLAVQELDGSLDTPSPRLVWHALVEQTLIRSSELQEAQARLEEGEQLWRLAYAQRIPNFTVAATPFYNGESRDTRVALSITAPLPLFNRNQGNIIAAQADVARLGAEVKQVELRLTERLAAAFQRYQTAYQQVESYRERILPKADEARKLIEFGYAKGDAKYNYTAVLQAQQVLFQAELSYVQVLGELWRALSELSGLLQEERLLGAP